MHSEHKSLVLCPRSMLLDRRLDENHKFYFLGGLLIYGGYNLFFMLKNEAGVFYISSFSVLVHSLNT